MTFACEIAGCGRAAFCRDLCRGHYARLRRGADTATPLRPTRASKTRSRAFACRLPPELYARLAEAAAAAGRSTTGYAAQIIAEAVGLPE